MYYSYILLLEILGAMAVSSAVGLVTQVMIAFLDSLQVINDGEEPRWALIPGPVKREFVSREARNIWIKRVESPGI